MADSQNDTVSYNRSKHPPPPLPIPSGHRCLRLLCHASLVGPFIGKSGSSIKHLQLHTGSRIRVQDSLLPGSDDRVILIVVPTLPSKRLHLHGQVYEVSAVQEAAVRVFERVLEVWAELDGCVAGGGVVCCRVLVEGSEAGAVIGKGGRVVEKLRRDSGARIRVLYDQQLPPGIPPPYEVVEIEGEVLSVKKALIGVSSRLLECPALDKSAVKENMPLESTSHPAVPDLRIEPQHFTAVRATDPLSPALTRQPLSLQDDNRCDSDPKAQQEEVVFKILCSNDRVGGVIGRGGSIIRGLQEESGATISIGPSIADCDERLVTITSTEDTESRYSPAQRAVVLVFSRSVDAGVENGIETGWNKNSSIIARLIVPSNQVGCLLGKGGAIISDMRKATRTSIRIFRGDLVPKCASEDDEVVEISGQFASVKDALYQVTGRLRNNLFGGKVISVPAPRSRVNASVTVDGNLHGRVGQSTLRHCLESLPIPHRPDHSPSPGFRMSEVASGFTPRAFVNHGGALCAVSGVEEGRASRPIITNTTVEILLPEGVVSSVYGENESNLDRIRQISGAKVTVHEPQARSNDTTVIISGTPDEVQAAQSLLHAFIVTGPA